MKNQETAIKQSEKLVNKLNFWGESDTMRKRTIRRIIRNNYRASVSIFTGFFGNLRTSHGDIQDEETMTIMKSVEGIDKVQYKKAIMILKKHGFRLSVFNSTENTKVVMVPGDAISEFKTGTYIEPTKVDYKVSAEKMKLLH